MDLQSFGISHKNILDLFKCGVCVMKEDKIIYCNNRAMQLLGYEKMEEMIDLNPLEFSPQKQLDGRSSQEKGKQLIQDAVECEEYIDFKWLHEQKNGETFLAECRLIVKNGVLYYLFCLIDEEESLKPIVESLFLDSPNGRILLDINKTVMSYNKKFLAMFGMTEEDVDGKFFLDIFPTQVNAKNIEENLLKVYEGEVLLGQGKRQKKDGTFIHVDIIAYPIMSQKRVLNACITYIDAEEKKKNEEQLMLFKHVLENNTEGVVITDASGTILWINKGFERITGYSLQEVVGKNPRILKSGVHDDGFYKDMWDSFIKKGHWSGEIWNKNKAGIIYPEYLSIQSVKKEGDTITHYIGVLKDISEKKIIDERLRSLEERDSLTGLASRSYFKQQVDQNIVKYSKTNKLFALLFIDIDNFQEINESLGHHLGDQLLINFSRRLTKLLNKNLVLSRISGDEFVFLYKSYKDESELSNFAEEILNEIKKPFLISGMKLYISADIGISVFPIDGSDSESLIRFADIAMHQARAETNTRVHFYSKGMSEDIKKNFLIANNIKNALKNNELSIVYQPIINLNWNKIECAEALLRWHTESLGSIPPDKFIGVAEKTGQIIEIGYWVIHQVCAQQLSWKKQGKNMIPISVNISVKQLEQADFAKSVKEILMKYELSSHYIEIEITESISLGQLGVIVDNLKELKEAGFKISMDDFGTGYSSLGQLYQFHLDKLKIDKVFVDEFESSEKRYELVRAIIAMAKSLDLLVVAEGIETKEQEVLLQNLNCDLGQGYLFSKPVTAKEFEKFL